MRKAIRGEISMPNLKFNGKTFLMGQRMGSVILYKNCTRGLNGAGFSQLIKARIRISHQSTFNDISRTYAMAKSKLDRINIFMKLFPGKNLLPLSDKE